MLCFQCESCHNCALVSRAERAMPCCSCFYRLLSSLAGNTPSEKEKVEEEMTSALPIPRLVRMVGYHWDYPMDGCFCDDCESAREKLKDFVLVTIEEGEEE